MEARNDLVGRQNEAVSGEQQPNGCLKSVNPFLHPAQTTINRLSSTDTKPFFTQAKDSNGNTISRANNKDLMLGHGQSNRWAHFPLSSTPSPENDWAVSPPLTLGQETTQTTFPSHKWDTAQDSYVAKTSATGLSKQKSNSFDPFKEETSVSQSKVANEKTSEEKDDILDYILANQKNNEKSILSSNQMDVLSDSSNFLHAPVINNDIFTNTDVQTPESSVQNKAFRNIQLFQNPASVQNELSHGIFQEPSTFSSPLNASTNEEPMFKRQPPKPAPRLKAPKGPNQSITHVNFSTPAPVDQKPVHTLFTPNLRTSIPAVQRATTNIQDTKLSDELNPRQVYEDVFFIGQEKCVEDWPEDSPELSPDWKPAGKLKLRRESMRISQESEEVLSTDPLGKKSVKKKKRLSISRRGPKDKTGDDAKALQIGTVRRESKGKDQTCFPKDIEPPGATSGGYYLPKAAKEKYPDSLNGAYGDTLPWGTKLTYYESDDLLLPEEEENQNAVTKSKSVKSKKAKFIVPHLQYKGSKKKSIGDVFENGSPYLQASESENIQESYEEKLRNSEQKEPVMKEHRPKKPTKLKLSLSHRLSKDSIENDLKRMNSLSFLEDTKENVRTENENRRLSADLLAEYQHDEFSPKSPDSSGKGQELQVCRKQKKFIKFSVPHLSWKGSKSTLENVIPQKGADLFKASDKGSEINVSEDHCQGGNGAEKGADLFKAGDIADDDWTEKRTMDLKTKMLKKTCLPSKESKAKDQMCFPEDIDPPVATSGGYYLSEAAKAEWMSSQMDVRRVRTPDNDAELEAVKEEVDGDTDSLMEWWNTVELWDELPDEEIGLKENETKSFTEIADKVHHGLRVFYKVFTEHAEVLYQHVLHLYTIGDDISNFHRRAKIANITGGTTTAVGGVAAITGLALAPVTLGASLIVSAVGLGLATAGGITAASASISDNVHDMNDRKKIEVVVQDYETRLAELRRCLQFVAEGLRRMRFHPLLRRNNYYAGDWDVRRALQTISLAGEPVENAEDIVERSTVALNSVCKGMDNYFCKDSKELKKGCKKEVTMQVNMLAKLLHKGLVALNTIRDQLMEAMGHV